MSFDLFGRAKSVFGAARNKVGSAVNSVSQATNLPKVVVGFLMTGALAGSVALGVSFLPFGNQNGFDYYWIGDEECENYVQAELNNQKKSGRGESQIPSDVKVQGYTVTWYGEGGFYFAQGGYKIAQSSDQYIVNQLWNEKKEYNDHLAVIDGLYLVAVKPFDPNTGTGVGNVGDVITFYLDDGHTSFDAIVADTKGAGAEGSPWGHPYGNGYVNVVEFEAEPTVGNPGSLAGEYHTDLGDGAIHSFTNHGIHPKLQGKLGSVGAAVANMDGLGNAAAAGAIEECKAERSFDNGTLAAALASYSMSRSTHQDDGQPSSPLYQEVAQTVLGADDFTASFHYHSCDRGVAAAVRWCGADLDFPAGACAAQYEYVTSHPKLWEPVTTGPEHMIAGMTDEEATTKYGLQPGDIAITCAASGGEGGNEHILAYVGEEACTQAYEKVVKGLSGADVGTPEPGTNIVSASFHQRGANMHPSGGDDRTYKWFRYKGDYPEKDKYKDVGARVTLASTSVKSTSCDCLECEKKEEKVDTSDIVELAKTHIGTEYVYGAGHSSEAVADANPKRPRDCSSFVSWCYYQAWGISIGNGGQEPPAPACTSSIGSDVGSMWKEIPASEAQPGDILNNASSHVMLYCGKLEQADPALEGVSVGDDYVIHETPPATRAQKIDLQSTMQSYKLLRWIGPGAKDTTSPSTKKSSNTGNENCGQKCFDGGKFDDTFMISDSIGAGSQEQIKAALPGIKTDLEGGRRYESDGAGDDNDGGIDIARREAGKYDRYVIEIGINDAGLRYEMAKEFMSVLGKTNTQVFFVNQHVKNSGNADDITDDAIDKIVADYDNAFKVDWRSIAAAHWDEYIIPGDNCHLTEAGAEAFANAIREKMAGSTGCNTGVAKDINDGEHGSGAWYEATMSSYCGDDNSVDQNACTVAIPLSLKVEGSKGHKLEVVIGDKSCIVTVNDFGGFGDGSNDAGFGVPRRLDATCGTLNALGVTDTQYLGKVRFRNVDMPEEAFKKLITDCPKVNGN